MFFKASGEAEERQGCVALWYFFDVFSSFLRLKSHFQAERPIGGRGGALDACKEHANVGFKRI